MLARNEDLQQKLVSSNEWDLIICDEAHRMAGNGFANRFLFARVTRARVLPFGGDRPDLTGIATRLGKVIAKRHAERVIGWSKPAADIWIEVYPELSEGRPGLIGAVTSRAEAQTLRLALTYALLDGATAIEEAHIKAALAVWDYCDASAASIFGRTVGDPVADEIMVMLKGAPDGLNRTDISNAFGRNRSSDEIGRALASLQAAGRVRVESTPTGGRPAERWFSNE